MADTEEIVPDQIFDALDTPRRTPKLPTVKEMYAHAVEYYDDNFAWFLTHVLNLGTPVADQLVPSACIFWNDTKERLEFHINPKMATLDVPSFSFVVAHETMHARLRHFEYLKLFGNHKKANVAADVVINDYLLSRGFEWPTEEWAEGVNGENQLGYNTYIGGPLSVKDVYDLLPDNGNGEGEDGEGGGCGLTSDQVKEAIKEALKNPQQSGGQAGPGDKVYQYGSGNKDLDEKIDKALGELSEEIKDMNNKTNKSNPGGLTQGFGLDTELKAWSEDTGTTLAWAKLMFKVDPELFDKWGIGKPPRMDFHRRPRALAAIPGVMLPVKAESRGTNEKYTDKIPHVVLALDSSGSCIHLIDKFITLARSIPKNRVDLWCCTFDTRYIEQTNLDEPRYTSGGTQFSVIEDFIQDKMTETGRSKYPQAIIVITDGYADFNYALPPEGQWGNWYWLLDGQDHSSDTHGVGKEHYFQLEDYVI